MVSHLMDNRNSEPYWSKMPILPIYVPIWTGAFADLFGSGIIRHMF